MGSKLPDDVKWSEEAAALLEETDKSSSKAMSSNTPLPQTNGTSPFRKISASSNSGYPKPKRTPIKPPPTTNEEIAERKNLKAQQHALGV